MFSSKTQHFFLNKNVLNYTNNMLFQQKMFFFLNRICMLILSQNTSFSPEQFQFLSEPEPGLFQQQPVLSQLLHVQQ